ncbi:KpsF/GutQ family sugar-phosphate isomerase [Pandoraea sp. XJJ-1]|uniref:Arabinose 5-phosphate isomerase n=1 Tax=Pandoraea cepalis TaxID=2508294 RepID=A0A5E4S2E9_9BURK|nr:MULTISPECIES: KpsF/GutQ family sugar-phosphate isomerase [Pandoraea]MDN4575738.1 KpsF/GutQ family sugar-phosphate isomerase [Pandoraea cepalis]MDN4580840.1 KpsF/GutQ family sugar-phosphate isomerase [Pandoraea cepalis]OJY21538.1 MAG: arabinose-5-phosphate isomerase [Pandoraea sp. 64-18]QBC30498.1 KpsF/GutQ family sugar-phosphate isomerase [Pandoraea sp. XY-2]WAL83389.1 KpsF/GutQ family sugar-phosphate isomerase [Pandoraea sp. XJJ-1]
MIAKINPGRALEVAREVLRTEADAIERVSAHLDDSFFEAISLLLACRGRVVVTGMGKSGHIGRKLAATFASTGTPAFFVHPAEASHGDLGMITTDDVVVALSNSGETGELVSILPMIKRIGAKLIAMTGNAASSLGRLSDVHLDAHVDREACPLGLAPTASTTAALALGDALAVTLLDARGFGAEDFARSHPGGALGRRLLTFVRDVMRTGERVPRVRADASLSDALLEMTAKGLGMTAIVDADDRVVGIFTDGDLRRLFKRTLDFTTLTLADVMKAGPRSIGPDQLAAEAAELMERFGITQLLVTENDRLVGALNVHDLFAAKVV